MTSLEAVRRLVEANPTYLYDGSGTFTSPVRVCSICDQQGGHSPDCPWLAMPQVLAALEAAERVVGECDEAGIGIPIGGINLAFNEAIEDLVVALAGRVGG